MTWIARLWNKLRCILNVIGTAQPSPFQIRNRGAWSFWSEVRQRDGGRYMENICSERKPPSSLQIDSSVYPSYLHITSEGGCDEGLRWYGVAPRQLLVVVSDLIWEDHCHCVSVPALLGTGRASSPLARWNGLGWTPRVNQHWCFWPCAKHDVQAKLLELQFVPDQVLPWKSLEMLGCWSCRAGERRQLVHIWGVPGVLQGFLSSR